MDDLNQDDFKHAFGIIRAKALKSLDAAFDDAVNHGAGYLNVDSNGVKNIPIADVKQNDLRELADSYLHEMQGLANQLFRQKESRFLTIMESIRLNYLLTKIDWIEDKIKLTKQMREK